VVHCSINRLKAVKSRLACWGYKVPGKSHTKKPKKPLFFGSSKKRNAKKHEKKRIFRKVIFLILIFQGAKNKNINKLIPLFFTPWRRVKKRLATKK
jgi:hypothetical protein